jgi:Haem-binding domain
MERTRIAALMVAGGALIAFGLMQLKPVLRTNPPVTGDIAAPAPIEATLRRSCYDCHSNETHWRWYSAIAPVSWMVANHVEMGRKEMDFSEWRTYYPATQRRKLEWMGRALHEEVMPPFSYRVIHPGSRLSDQDRAALEQWITSEITRPEGSAAH